MPVFFVDKPSDIDEDVFRSSLRQEMEMSKQITAMIVGWLAGLVIVLLVFVDYPVFWACVTLGVLSGIVAAPRVALVFVASIFLGVIVFWLLLSFMVFGSFPFLLGLLAGIMFGMAYVFTAITGLGMVLLVQFVIHKIRRRKNRG